MGVRHRNFDLGSFKGSVMNESESGWIHIKSKDRIRFCIKVIAGSGSGSASKWKGRIRSRIRISLQMPSQNVWNMSILDYFFKILSLYLEARIRPRINMNVKGRIQIRNQSDKQNRSGSMWCEYATLFKGGPICFLSDFCFMENVLE